MFGFSKQRRTVELAVHYCKTMFAGIEQLSGKPVPNTVYADAYVAGFIQQLILFAILQNERSSPDPAYALKVASLTYDTLMPGLSATMISHLQQLNDPAYPYNSTYLEGQSDGKNYVLALLNGSEDLTSDIVFKFRGLIYKEYV